MTQKHYCQKCKNLIEEGSNYRGYRYSYGPRNWFIYYLCPQCFQQQKEEIKTQRDKNWQQVSTILIISLIVIAVSAILFLLYQYRQDRKIDRITKKAQKK
ncbi:hypothetical protein [endosymbiont DhMRE of Dentiscutata heterogama]|uniref:hypothetical protein n=1 Tax=endosymbiont DhMRE of Dentiscutata heterogama TaxID=1609546 RepID=UPI002AD3A0BE|nr:hypothetical protein [endosymbiont DhMRE of Dentiscutata heterogama]